MWPNTLDSQKFKLLENYEFNHSTIKYGFQNAQIWLILLIITQIYRYGRRLGWWWGSVDLVLMYVAQCWHHTQACERLWWHTELLAEWLIKVICFFNQFAPSLFLSSWIFFGIIFFFFSRIGFYIYFSIYILTNGLLFFDIQT